MAYKGTEARIIPPESEQSDATLDKTRGSVSSSFLEFSETSAAVLSMCLYRE